MSKIMADNNTNELLLIDSANPIPVTEVNKWMGTDPANVTNFIKNIKTSESKADDREVFKTLISGVPTPWARVMITRLAVCANRDELGTNTLDNCYKAFKDEWRGLIAAYALRKDSFEFSSPIELLGKDIRQNHGSFNILNIYGSMLFDDTPLWVYHNKAIDSENPPKIQILYYKKNDDGKFKYIPVGATSPYTILFPSINYNLSERTIREDIPWVNANGKFTDPTDNPEVSTAELQRLHAFIYNAKNQIDTYLEELQAICTNTDVREKYNVNLEALREDIYKFQTELSRWSDALRIKLSDKVNTQIPTSVSMPEGPIAKLLNTEFTFWYKSGTLYTKEQDSSFKINDTEIFIDSEYICAWKQTPGRDYDLSPAYYLKAVDEKQGDIWWLALPFSKKAMEQMNLEKSISAIMEGKGDISLHASVGNDGKVDVKLLAKLNGESSPISICQKTFQMRRIEERDGKVFTWPDFRSDKWHRYYYYSEFPTNVSGIRMMPTFEDGADIDKLIEYPVNKVTTNKHRYEICESDKPLKSISIIINVNEREAEAGLLLIKSEGNDRGTQYRAELPADSFSKAVVGIDFGSTNTCAYYKLENESVPHPVPFKNRRLALVGFDNEDGGLALPDELYFISNESPVLNNGQVKSWIHDHDRQYIPETIGKDREIAGGVPVNEANIAIRSMNEHTIITQAGELHYNMKWLSDAKNSKTSFISTLWLQICADLFETGAKPDVLHWSFPSSMGARDRRDLGRIYEHAVRMNVADGFSNVKRREYTESEAVCAYALSKQTRLDSKHVAVGIDVGGSTSDILIMGKKEGEIRLLTQSSVRMAGGFFFKAIQSSKEFRDCIAKFVKSNKGINVLNIEDVESPDSQLYSRAPYYLGNIFDALKTDNDFYNFYETLLKNVPKIFSMPAYVTGMLMFYSGLLSSNVIRNNAEDLSAVETFHVRYYGKGGRLFEWLFETMSDDAARYYRKCFQAGFGSQDIKVVIDNQGDDDSKQQSRKENKSEVAIGLANDNFVNLKIVRDEDEERVIENYDVIGEKGIVQSKTKEEFKDTDLIPDTLFENGINILFPDTFENFNAFMTIFLKFIKDAGFVDELGGLSKGKDNLDVEAFIRNDREYVKYRKECEKEEEDVPVYRMPIIIAAALKYLNDVLIPETTR